ncbi:MAG: hypothetical protein WAW63_04235 [Candidatus Saccharimonadales bacterium]
MIEARKGFPYGDIRPSTLNDFAFPASGTGLEALPPGEDTVRRNRVIGLLLGYGRAIPANPLSPSSALGGRLAPPQSTLTPPIAHANGLQLYHKIILTETDGKIQDTAAFDRRLTTLQGLNTTRISQLLLPLMKWSKRTQSRYYGLVEAKGRDYSRPLRAALFLGAYIGMYVERGTEDIDSALYAAETLPFMPRSRTAGRRH